MRLNTKLDHVLTSNNVCFTQNSIPQFEKLIGHSNNFLSCVSC